MTGNVDYKAILKSAFTSATELLEIDRKNHYTFQDREIKIELDQKLDHLFKETLQSETDLPVYSEESLGEYPKDKKTWVIDPLDGSLNYFRGIPFFTSSICLWEAGKPVLGAIYDYSRNDFYYGVVGVGAFLNDQPLFQNSNKKLMEIKATGIPSHSSTKDALDLFATSLKEYKKLRWFGCASLSLAYVAAGKVDAYEEQGIKIWDVAAGMALVEAAGGKIQFTFNSNGSLHLRAE